MVRRSINYIDVKSKVKETTRPIPARGERISRIQEADAKSLTKRRSRPSKRLSNVNISKININVI